MDIRLGQEIRTTVIGSDRLDEVRALLYRVYSRELGWHPPAGNPSAQKVVRLGSGELGLVDRYDLACTWVGLLCGDQIVGCVRLIERADNNLKLELENYCTLPGRIIESMAGLLEVNRLAVVPAFRGGHTSLMLLAHALEIAERTSCSAITALTRVMARYVRIYGGMQDTGLRFFYHHNDPEEVAVLLLDNQDRGVERQLSILRERLAREGGQVV